MKHTPGKWSVTSDVIPTAYRIRSTDTMVATCYHNPILGWDNSRIHESDPDGPGMQESKANAEFIVKAVNSHYELLEACQDLLEQIQPLRCINLTTKKETGIKVMKALNAIKNAT